MSEYCERCDVRKAVYHKQMRGYDVALCYECYLEADQKEIESIEIMRGER